MVLSFEHTMYHKLCYDSYALGLPLLDRCLQKCGNFKEYVNAKDSDGYTPFFWLCYNLMRKKSLIYIIGECLSEHNADLNAINIDGTTPLHYLCNDEISLDLIRYYVNHNGNLNIKDNTGTTAFHIICNNKGMNLNILKYCMKHGFVDINVTNRMCETPLLYLCENMQKRKRESNKDYLRIKKCVEYGIKYCNGYVYINDHFDVSSIYNILRKNNMFELKMLENGDINKNITAETDDNNTFRHSGLDCMCNNTIDFDTLKYCVKECRGKINETNITSLSTNKKITDNEFMEMYRYLHKKGVELLSIETIIQYYRKNIPLWESVRYVKSIEVNEKEYKIF